MPLDPGEPSLAAHPRLKLPSKQLVIVVMVTAKTLISVLCQALYWLLFIHFIMDFSEQMCDLESVTGFPGSQSEVKELVRGH